MRSEKKLYNFEILKLDTVNVWNVSNFLDGNDFRFNHFYPHEFTVEYMEGLINSRDYYAVGFLDNEICAYGLLRGWEEGYSFPRLGIGVGEKFRNMGIATFMCQYLHFVAKLRGCDFVQLRVHKDNPIAYAMYRKLGYDMREQDENHWIGYFKCK
jgi:ribosomal protein S18 acetylase RimI-like enzyme